MSDKLHRIHAAPSDKGNRVDFGSNAGGFSFRPEGSASFLTKKSAARRIAVCWNVLEGWPTAALEDGCLREVDEAAHRLLEAIDVAGPGELPVGVALLAQELKQAFARRDRQQDRTDGRLHDCPGCLAKEAPQTEPDDGSDRWQGEDVA